MFDNLSGRCLLLEKEKGLDGSRKGFRQGLFKKGLLKSLGA